MARATAVLSFVAAAALAAPTTAQAWTTEVYYGTVFDRNEDYGGVSMPLDSGSAGGIGFYLPAGIPALDEIGIDIMFTDARYTGSDAGVESLSVMLNGRRVFPLGPGPILYSGLGLGMIRVTYDGGTSNPAGTGDDWVAGAQVGAGVRYNTGAVTIFTELKYKFAFDDATIQGVDQSYATTSLVAGVRF